MIKKLCKTLLLLSFVNSVALANSFEIYPTPHEVKSKGARFSLQKGYPKWNGKSKADKAALAVVKSLIGKNKIKITIGESSDPGMKKYKKVPNNKEGYYLKVSPQSIVLIGRSERGTYYGAQTLRQLLSY